MKGTMRIGATGDLFIMSQFNDPALPELKDFIWGTCTIRE